VQAYEVEIHVVDLQVLECAVQGHRDVLWRVVSAPAEEKKFRLDISISLTFQDFCNRNS
jgi:hypothetical protein